MQLFAVSKPGKYDLSEDAYHGLGGGVFDGEGMDPSGEGVADGEEVLIALRGLG